MSPEYRVEIVGRQFIVVAKWGAEWFSHIGEQDEVAVPVSTSLPEKNQPEKENQSVLKHHAQIAAESAGEICPACQNTGPTIVKRGPLFHCNPCGHDWPTLPPVVAVGGRQLLWKN